MVAPLSLAIVALHILQSNGQHANKVYRSDLSNGKWGQFILIPFAIELSSNLIMVLKISLYDHPSKYEAVLDYVSDKNLRDS